MECFKEIYSILKDRETEKPHHTTDRRLTNRGIGFRDGKEQGINFVAKRYTVGDHNYDQDKHETSRKISDFEAFELCKKHNIDIRHLPKKLGKRDFQLSGTKGNYSIDKITSNKQPITKGFTHD